MSVEPIHVAAVAGFVLGWMVRAIFAETLVRLALRVLSTSIGREAIRKAVGDLGERGS